MNLQELANLALLVGQAKQTMNSMLIPKHLFNEVRRAVIELERQFAAGLVEFSQVQPSAQVQAVPDRVQPSAVVVVEDKIAKVVPRENLSSTYTGTVSQVEVPSSPLEKESNPGTRKLPVKVTGRKKPKSAKQMAAVNKKLSKKSATSDSNS